MSDISRWWTQTATIQRLTTTGVIDTYGTSASIACLIQAFEPQRTDYLAQTLARPHRMWCALDTDCRDDDIVVSNGNRYTVRGIVRREQGLNPHLEVLLEQALGS